MSLAGGSVGRTKPGFSLSIMVQVPGATLEHGPEHSITIQNDLSDAQQAALGTPGLQPSPELVSFAAKCF